MKMLNIHFRDTENCFSFRKHVQNLNNNNDEKYEIVILYVVKLKNIIFHEFVFHRSLFTMHHVVSENSLYISYILANLFHKHKLFFGNKY